MRPLLEREADAVIAYRHGQAVTCAGFLTSVESLRAALPDCGHAINLCRDRLSFARAFSAVVAAGQTNLLPPNRLDSTVDELLRHYPDACILSDDDADTGRGNRINPRNVPEAHPAEAEVPRIPETHLAAIVFTSGSTGEPKPIEKPWNTLLDGTRINATEMGLDKAPGATVVATVPPQHMYGMETSVLLPLASPVAISNRQPFLPADIAAELAALPSPRVLISTPAHLRSLADPGLELPPLEAVWCATAPLDPELARVIETRHGTRVREIYGCSETGSLAQRSPTKDSAWALFSGFVLTVEQDATRASADHLPRSFVLQDRVELLEAGRFRLTGRAEDLVNIAGKRASLADLNLRLLRVPGVEDGVIFQPPAAGGGRPDRLAALVVAPALDVVHIRRELRKLVDEAFLPRPIHLVAELPRAETGKLSRRAVLALFEQQRCGGG